MRSIHGIFFSFIIFIVFGGTAPIAQAQAAVTRFDLPAQPLADSLRAVGSETNTNILFDPPLVAGHKAPPLKAELTVAEALTRLLVGTGIKHEFLNETTVVLSGGSSILEPHAAVAPASISFSQTGDAQPTRLAQTGPAVNSIGNTTDEPAQSPSKKDAKSSSSKQEDSGLTEIVVTGTNIHHIEPISPMITITGQDMIDQGYSRLDQVFDQLPQNFKSGVSQESAPALQPGKDSINNQSYSSGVNLRGLGPGATLVLLNGRRLATTALGASVDISSIPVSAIDRVEILTDGASAIYGSDAIAGVVNIITKQDYSGLETGVRSTGISQGKNADYGGHILGGYDWASGNFLINFDGEKDGDLLASNRSFMPSSDPSPLDLLPEQIRRNLYAAVRQQLSDRLSLASDVLVSDRTFTVQENKANFAGDTSGSAQQLAASLELDFAISRDWTAKVSGQASREKDMDIGFSSAIAPNSPPKSLEQYSYRTNSADAVVDGKLFDLPGGALRAALGGQYKHESMDSTSGRYGQPLPVFPTGDRTSEAAYGELYIPIVGSQNAIPFLRELNLDLAERYDHYSDFGSTANPKVALQWVPIESLTLHGAYSKSFRAPQLNELGAGFLRTGYVIPEPNPASPTGTTTTLVLDGSNPNLQAEHAKSYNAGLTFKPTMLPGLKFDASFFHIDYKDRVDRLILEGFFGEVFTKAGELGSIVNTNPTIGQVNASVASINPGNFFDGTNGYCQVGLPGCPFNPASIQAIANLGFVNVGVATVQGYDFNAQYKWDGSFGQIIVDFDGTLLTDNSIQITPTTLSTSLLNDVNEPLRFRAKMNFGWRRSEWAAYGRVNFANAYHNSEDPGCAGVTGCTVAIASWTTVDSGISYTTPSDNHRLGSGLRLAIDVANLFNREPPYVNRLTAGIPLTYDPLNANPLLRTIGVSITKAW